MEKQDVAKQGKVKASLIGLDNLIEDLFGLNAKAFRSIWLSFRAPAKYADAATSADWRGSFTPTVRVWVGLVALYSALRFFYGSEDGTMTQMYVEILETAIADNPETPLADIDSTLLAQSILKWATVFLPFIMLPLYAVVAFIFRVWPDKPSFVIRFRYVMLTVVPSTAFTALTTVGLIFLSGPWLSGLMTFSIIGIIILDWVTAYRGTLNGISPSSRLGLSFVMTALLIVVFLLGSVLSGIPAVTAAMMEIAPKL